MRKALIGIVLCGWANAALAQEVVVAALGDSLTQGFGLPVEQGLVAQLQDWLDANGHNARLINAGVSGDTTAGGLARVGWTLTPDVDAMIVALGGNDLLRGLQPAQARANIKGILEAAAAQDVEVLLVGMQAPGNYGPAYKAEFDAIYPELAARFGSLYQRSMFDGMSPAEGLPDPVTLAPLLQSDGIHPNAKGVARIIDVLGPNVAQLIARAAE